jgi:hypothetical protein
MNFLLEQCWKYLNELEFNENKQIWLFKITKKITKSVFAIVAASKI